MSNYSRWQKVLVLLVLAAVALVALVQEDKITSVLVDNEEAQEMDLKLFAIHANTDDADENDADENDADENDADENDADEKDADEKDADKDDSDHYDDYDDHDDEIIVRNDSKNGIDTNSEPGEEDDDYTNIADEDEDENDDNSVEGALDVSIEEEPKKKDSKKDTLPEMKTSVAAARMEVDKMIEEDYGKFKETVFTKDAMLSAFQSPSTLSVERLQRRILIKILEAQLRSDDDDDVSFIWAIGGHSAAAGHGNIFNQTYGFILEQTARPVFKALGITFFGKNYAAGGTQSGPINSLCMSAVYGPDLDVLSWDFGMTDGRRATDLYNMWVQRAGVHPTFPTLISYGGAHAMTVHPEIESAGMSAFEAVFINKKGNNYLAAKFPDSDDPNVNAAELPRGVKNYRCGGQTESGGPCGDKSIKFNTTICGDDAVNGKVSWHNGYKDHLLKGRVSALFLIENVFGALSKLDATDDTEDGTPAPSISNEYLNHLYSLEESDKKSFLSSETPTDTRFENGPFQELHDLFLRSSNVCRHSFLPSYTRYEGILTGYRQDIEYLGGGRTTYKDEGVDLKNAPPAPKPNSPTEPLLVFNYGNDRGICKHADIDFKDYFGIRNEDEWVATVVPSDAEIDAFVSEDDSRNRKGVIVLCERMFDWGKIPQGFVSIDSMLNATETTMFVNDVPVTRSARTHINFDKFYCHMLGNEEGYTFPGSEMHGEGRYEIQLKVPEKGGVLYLSSIIIY